MTKRGFEDADLVEAMAALDRTVTDGTFEGFSRKVAARMERTDLPVHDTASTGDEPAIGAGPLPPRDENSGLHEIRELATTAKRRLSARSSAQPEPGDDLLTSSGAFKTVVLPDPGRQSGEIPTMATMATMATMPAVAPVRPESRASGRGVLWAAIAVAGLAAAAAITLFVTRPGDTSVQNDERTVAAREPTPARAAAETNAPADEPPRAQAAEGGAPAAADPNSSPGGSPSSIDKASAAAAAAPSPNTADEAEPEHARREPAERDVARARQGAEPPAPPAEVREPTKAKAEMEAKVDKRKPAKGGSEDALLESVTGGVEESTPAPEPSKKPEKPSKTGLDRDDVSHAMAAVGDRARACQETEGAVGSVNIRFTVDPSGKVTRASATGKFAGTATGSCVAAAVKRAHFPTWDGGPMSFTFPFLLTQ